MILEFINEFAKGGYQVNKCFLHGNCYWFAYILRGRFPKGRIVYNAVENHFGFKLNDEVYDIRGIVTDLGDWEDWGTYHLKDPKHAKRIEKYCILKDFYDDPESEEDQSR